MGESRLVSTYGATLDSLMVLQSVIMNLEQRRLSVGKPCRS